MSDHSNVPAAPKRADFVPLNKVSNLAELFRHPDFKQRLAAAVPKHFNSERLLRTMVQAVQKTPKLAEVNPMSMLGACITLAALGLEPNTPLGHAHLIPFEVKKFNPATRQRDYVRTDVQVIIGYPGYLDLIYRGDKVEAIHCDVFWQDEVESGAFSYEYGSKKHLTHRPSGKRRAPGEQPAGAYMYATLKNGGEEFTVMHLADLHAIRARSQGFQAAMYAYDDAKRNNKDPEKDKRYSEAPWIKHDLEMYKKTALRSGQKWLPKSVELAAAITIDGEAETGALDFSKIIEGNQVLDGAYEAESVPELTEEHTVPLDLKVGDKATADLKTGEIKRTPVKPGAPHRKPRGELSREEIAERFGEQEAPVAQPPSATKTEKPAVLSTATYPLFNAFGEEDDGPSGPATDPVAFAERFAKEYGDSDESGQEALREFNEDSIERAALASEKAQEILNNAISPAKPANFEELYDIPITKTDRGVWNQVEWVKQAKAKMSEIQHLGYLREFAKVNEAKANSLNTTARTVYHNYLDGCLAKLGGLPEEQEQGPPAPEQGDPGYGAVPENEDPWMLVAQKLTEDFTAAKDVHELEAISKNVAVKAQLRQLKEARPDLANQLEDFYSRRFDDLKGKHNA